MPRPTGRVGFLQHSILHVNCDNKLSGSIARGLPSALSLAQIRLVICIKQSAAGEAALLWLVQDMKSVTGMYRYNVACSLRTRPIQVVEARLYKKVLVYGGSSLDWDHMLNVELAISAASLASEMLSSEDYQRQPRASP